MTEERIPLQKAREMSKEEREQLIKTIEESARDNEIKYYGCSQAVLGALQQYLDIGCDETFKAATAFAGGVGRMREACGALCGGVMAISVAYGRARFEDGKVGREQPDYQEAQARANKLGNQFQETFGSCRCDDIRVSIRGADYKDYTGINTLEAYEDHKKCGDVTGPAARLAAEILLEPTELFAAEIKAALEGMAQIRKLMREVK
ncbi:C-GCAxxG-C-C family protein [Chloroflexota bacterium]